jgi:hypothetical protein
MALALKSTEPPMRADAACDPPPLMSRISTSRPSSVKNPLLLASMVGR